MVAELRAKQPLLDLRLLKDRLFRYSGLVSVCGAAGLLGMWYVFPLMYQNVLNASALETGLTTFPEALGLMIASQLVPWTYGAGIVCTIERLSPVAWQLNMISPQIRVCECSALNIKKSLTSSPGTFGYFYMRASS